MKQLRPGLRWIIPVVAILVSHSFSLRSEAQSQDRGYLPPSQQDQGQGSNSDQDYSKPRPITPPSRQDSQRREEYRRDDGRDPGYGQSYTPPPREGNRRREDERNDYDSDAKPGTYSSNEIVDTGQRFFGDVSEGLARVVEHTFRKYGRPNGYILGDEAGGAIVAGLRYGEGTLHTKEFGNRKIYWQGPSIGYDFGAAGSRSMTLIYNLRDPYQMFERFGGVDGSAYLVGGAGVTYLQRDDVILAPIRAGVGLRLGANVGYLKFTPSPTWNPF